jgi:hypothetical protein
MTWKQLGNSLTTENVLAKIKRGWLKNAVQRLIGYGYLQNTIYRNTFFTFFETNLSCLFYCRYLIIVM